MFDRIAPNITLAYDSDGVAEGRGFKDQADANSEFDVKAAIDHVASAGAVVVVGFCWGGSLAWRMACDEASGLAAAISYYGDELPSLVRRDTTCPVMAHFGIHDASIPEARAALPRRSHWLKRIFMMLGTVLTATIAASMMQMRLHWLGGGAWRFWKHIWPDNGKG